jgi:aminoglycoside 6'-N-acetyltransferase
VTAGPALAGRRVLLRPGTPADVADLVAVFDEDAVRRWWHDHDASEVGRLLADPGTTGWVVELEGAVVGWVQVAEEPDPAYRCAQIDIAMATATHGTGAGGDVLRTVMHWLVHDRGHHRITIDPAADNARAIRAYEKAGFRTVGVMRAYETLPDGSHRDGLLMEHVVGVDG